MVLTEKEVFKKIENEISLKASKGCSNGSSIMLWYKINGKELEYDLEDFNIETVENFIKKINGDIGGNK